MKLQESEKIIEEYVGKARSAGKESVSAKLSGSELVVSSTPRNYRAVSTTSMADDSLKIPLNQPKHVNGMLVSGDIALDERTDLQVAAIILKQIQNGLDGAKKT